MINNIGGGGGGFVMLVDIWKALFPPWSIRVNYSLLYQLDVIMYVAESLRLC